MNINELKTSLNEVYTEELESKKAFSEGLLGKFEKWQQDKAKEIEEKRKNKDSKNSSELDKKINNYILTNNDMKELNDQINNMIKELKSNYNRMKSTSEFKNKCIKSSKEYNNIWPDDKVKIGYIPRVNITIFESLSNKYWSAIIEVIIDDQDIRIQYDWILYDLVDSLKGKYDFDFGYGDGDEGCLYLTVNRNYIKKRVMEDDNNE